MQLTNYIYYLVFATLVRSRLEKVLFEKKKSQSLF